MSSATASRPTSAFAIRSRRALRFATTCERTVHNSKQGLVKLPAELRNYIWELVIESNEELDTSKRLVHITRLEAAKEFALMCRQRREAELGPNYYGNKKHAMFYKADLEGFLQRNPSEWDLHSPLTPAVTQVCTVLRPETLRYFYGSNVFELHTGDSMEYDDMKRWLSHRPQIGLDAIRRVNVSYTMKAISTRSYWWRRADIYGLKLSLNFGSGVAESVALTDRIYDAESSSWKPSPRRLYPGFSGLKEHDDWPVGCVASYVNLTAIDITLPVGVLTEKIEEVKRLHCFGDGEMEMTGKRLMKIVKAFNFYKKGFYKTPENITDTMTPSPETSTSPARFGFSAIATSTAPNITTATGMALNSAPSGSGTLSGSSPTFVSTTPSNAAPINTGANENRRESEDQSDNSAEEYPATTVLLMADYGAGTADFAFVENEEDPAPGRPLGHLRLFLQC